MLATLMNVVGNTAVAVTVTMLTPVAALTVDVKKLGSAVGSVDDDVPRYPAGKLALKICVASALRIAAVEAARRAERRAVHGLAQLGLHHVGPAGVDGQAGRDHQQRQDRRHVDEDETRPGRTHRICV